MTYYLDFGPEGSSVREPISFRAPPTSVTVTPYRKVSQFVIFSIEPPNMAKYRAKNIIQKVGDNYYYTKKVGESIDQPGRKLTSEEEYQLMLQVLKSEVWIRRSE
jgi:hypothetical protein